ncbi:MAG: glycosyltransferase family 2 protein [Planctomycetales bacterium]
MSSAGRDLISVVFSFRNEELVLPELLDRLHAVLRPLDVDYEFVFVNDASTDRSLEILKERSARDDAIRIVTMANRFGLNPCFKAGIRHARGDAVITMDADLQDPPEVIPELIRNWRAGADVVYATRSAREGESTFKSWITRTAYRILRKVSDTDLPVEAGMFRLMSRRVVDELNRIDERRPYLRGVISWVGFDQRGILYRREKRFAGKAHFPLFGRAPYREFIAGLVGFGDVILDWILFGGVAVTGAALFWLVCLGIAHVSTAGVGAAWFLAAALSLFAGVQLVATGLVAQFVARVYAQVNRRPEYIVAETWGFPDDERRGVAAAVAWTGSIPAAVPVADSSPEDDA